MNKTIHLRVHIVFNLTAVSINTALISADNWLNIEQRPILYITMDLSYTYFLSKRGLNFFHTFVMLDKPSLQSQGGQDYS